MVIIDWVRKMILSHRNKQRVEGEDMNNEILEAVLEYYNGTNNDLALLINGTWGSGKTYFIKNILPDKLGDMRLVYVSLFGIDSIKELNNRITDEVLTKIIVKNGKAQKALSGLHRLGIPMLGLIPDYGNVVTEFLKQAEEPLANFFNSEKFIYCFDDLERTTLDIKDVLGVINSTLEKGIKTLVLVNEEKLVCKKDEGDNLQEITCYKEFKEKIVGHTLEYSVYLEKNFDAIVSKWSFCEPAKTQILTNRLNIISMMAYLKCNNLRTLRFALGIFETVYKNISKDKTFLEFSNEDKNKLWPQLILQCLGISFNQREKRKNIEWKEDELEQYVVYCPADVEDKDAYRYPSMQSYYMWTAKGIYQYVTKLIYDEESITATIVNQLCRIKNEREGQDDPLYLFNDWQNMNEQDVRKLMEALQQNFYDSKYAINQYGDILKCIVEPSKILGQEDVVSNCFKKMIANINKLQNISRTDYIREELFNKDVNSQIFQLNKCLEEREKEMFRCTINKMLQADDFPTNILDDYRSMQDIFLRYNSFAGLFDEQLLQKIVSSMRGGAIWDFGHLLNIVYSFDNIKDFYSADKKTLENLCTYIDTRIDKSNLDKMDIFRFQKLKETISGILERL